MKDQDLLAEFFDSVICRIVPGVAFVCLYFPQFRNSVIAGGAGGIVLLLGAGALIGTAIEQVSYVVPYWLTKLVQCSTKKRLFESLFQDDPFNLKSKRKADAGDYRLNVLELAEKKLYRVILTIFVISICKPPGGWPVEPKLAPFFNEWHRWWYGGMGAFFFLLLWGHKHLVQSDEMARGEDGGALSAGPVKEAAELGRKIAKILIAISAVALTILVVVLFYKLHK